MLYPNHNYDERSHTRTHTIYGQLVNQFTTHALCNKKGTRLRLCEQSLLFSFLSLFFSWFPCLFSSKKHRGISFPRRPGDGNSGGRDNSSRSGRRPGHRPEVRTSSARTHVHRDKWHAPHPVEALLNKWGMDWIQTTGCSGLAQRLPYCLSFCTKISSG